MNSVQPTSRKKFVCGNWKMNGTLEEARHLLFQIENLWRPEFKAVSVAVCPPFTALFAMQEACEKANVSFGAQNCHFEQRGAFTGEIAAPMLSELGCKFVILGHSERRTLFGESDELVAKKLRAVVDNGMTAIVCIGETEQQREQGETEAVLARQISGSLATISARDTPTLVIAYEPVWAIGTGKTASAQQAQEAHRFIRQELRKRLSDRADAVQILYGGSVKPNNALELFGQPDIDGGLIGGASLDAQAFVEIISAAATTT